MSRPRGRPPGARSETTREQIVVEARQAFADKGYAGASMRGIAEAAGLTAMGLYNYVDSKAELYEMVWQETITRIYAEYEEAVADMQTVADEIEAVLDRTRDILLSDPGHLQLAARLVLDRQHPDLVDLDLAAGPATAFLKGMGVRAVRRGELSTNEAAHLATFVITLLWGITAMATIESAALDPTLAAARWAVRHELATRTAPAD